MSNSNVRLPMTYPIIDTTASHAFLLSALGNYEAALPWIYSNYIQMYMNADYNLHFTSNDPSVTRIPWILVAHMYKDIVVKAYPNNIKQFAVDCLNDGYYVHLFLDEYYVPGTPPYQKSHFTHNILLHGFSTDEQLLFIAGHFTSRKYSFNEAITFSQFEEAFLSVESNSLIVLYKIPDLENNPLKTFMLDLDLIHDSLYDYLTSKNTMTERRMNANIRNNHVFGMNVYDRIREYVELLSKKEVRFNTKIPHTLYNHKTCMCARVEYLNRYGHLKNNTSLLNSLNEIAADALNLRNLMLKYSISSNDETYRQILSLLTSIEEKERVALQDFADSIIR